jgi:hypothetical protein
LILPDPSEIVSLFLVHEEKLLLVISVETFLTAKNVVVRVNALSDDFLSAVRAEFLHGLSLSLVSLNGTKVPRTAAIPLFSDKSCVCKGCPAFPVTKYAIPGQTVNKNTPPGWLPSYRCGDT